MAANAFFAAAEFALVSVRDTRIQQLIDARRIGARIVQKLHRNLDEVVNGVQLGITIASLTLGWVGEPLLAQMMLGPVQDVPHASVYAHGIAIAISFILITCPARDSGRTGSEVAGSAARRAGGAGGRRARWTSS